jgi:hypothetical protein
MRFHPRETSSSCLKLGCTTLTTVNQRIRCNVMWRERNTKYFKSTDEADGALSK